MCWLWPWGLGTGSWAPCAFDGFPSGEGRAPCQGWWHARPPWVGLTAVPVPQDIPTGADSCVTSLSCDSHRSLIVAGLGDGSIRVYDRRMALSEW